MKVDSINQDFVDRIKKQLFHIFENGKTKDGISPNVDSNVPPQWYDKELFQFGQKLHRDNGVLFFFCHLLGLILGLFHNSAVLPLLSTGNSKTIGKLFHRYLLTGKYIKDWFRSDPFDSNSKCYKTLYLVKSMHKKVAINMNKTFGLQQDGVTTVWISQAGMVETQFAFIGFTLAFPKQFGFHNFKEKHFKALIHFWRVIGYCLGIDDEFNLCNGTVEETTEICRQLYFERWLPVIKKGEERIGIEMGKGLCIVFRKMGARVTYNSLMKSCSKFLDLNQDLFPLTSKKDKLYYILYFLLWNYLSRSKCLIKIITKIGDKRFYNALDNRMKIENDLNEKYSDIIYEMKCPMSNVQCPVINSLNS